MGSSLFIKSRMIFPAVLLLAASLVSATPLGLASEDLKPANKSSSSWACPEYGLAFWSPAITFYDNIPSWQECGSLCHVNELCSHWTWNHPRSFGTPRRCWLFSGDGGAHNDGNCISGGDSCTTS